MVFHYGQNSEDFAATLYQPKSAAYALRLKYRPYFVNIEHFDLYPFIARSRYAYSFLCVPALLGPFGKYDFLYLLGVAQLYFSDSQTSAENHTFRHKQIESG